jgi:hypothetical protein
LKKIKLFEKRKTKNDGDFAPQSSPSDLSAQAKPAPFYCRVISA